MRRSSLSSSSASSNGFDNPSSTIDHPLRSIRRQMLARQHKHSHPHERQEPLPLPPPPLLLNDSDDDSHPHLRQPRDTLRSLLFPSGRAATTPVTASPPMTQRLHAVPPTPRTPGRRHGALTTDSEWNRTPPTFFPRISRRSALEDKEEEEEEEDIYSSPEVTKKLRTETGRPMPAASMATRPLFRNQHVLRTLAGALEVPFPAIAAPVRPPGPPPLHVHNAPQHQGTPTPRTPQDRPEVTAKKSVDIADFPDIAFASLGLTATESKLSATPPPQRIVRSDNNAERRRPCRRMSAPSA